MFRRVVFAAVVLAAGAGLAGQASGQTVTAGAFCSSAGATGVTSTGTPMTCATTATDTQLRWRATSEVTTTTTAAAVTGSTTTTIRQSVSATPATAPIALTG